MDENYLFTLNSVKKELSYHIANYVLAMSHQIDNFSELKNKINSKFKKSEIKDDATNTALFNVKARQYRSKWLDLVSTVDYTTDITVEQIIQRSMSEIKKDIPENILLNVLTRVYNSVEDKNALKPIINKVTDIIDIPDILINYSKPLSQDTLNMLNKVYIDAINIFMELINIEEEINSESYESSDTFIVTDFKIPTVVLSKYKFLKTLNMNNIEQICTAYVIDYNKHEKKYGVEYFYGENNLKRIDTSDIGYLRFVTNKVISKLTWIVYENFDYLVPDINNIDVKFIYVNIKEIIYSFYSHLNINISKRKFKLNEDILEPIHQYITDIIMPLILVEDNNLIIISENNLSLPNYDEMVSQLKLDYDNNQQTYSIVIQLFNYSRVISNYSSKSSNDKLLTYTYDEIKQLISNLRYNKVSSYHSALDMSVNYLKTIGFDLIDSKGSRMFSYSSNIQLGVDNKVIDSSSIFKDLSEEPSTFLFTYRSELLDSILAYINVSEEASQVTLDKYWYTNKDKLLIPFLEQRIANINDILGTIISSIIVNYKDVSHPYIYNNIFEDEIVFSKVNLPDSVINRSSLSISSEYLSDILNLIILNSKIAERSGIKNYSLLDTTITDNTQLTFEDIYGYDFKFLSKPTVVLKPTKESSRQLIKLLLVLADKKFNLNNMTSSALKEATNTMIKPDNVVSNIFVESSTNTYTLADRGITDEFFTVYKKYIKKVLGYIPLDISSKISSIEIDRFSYEYASALLDTNYYNLPAEDVLFNNKNINNTGQDISNVEYIVDNLDDLLLDVSINNTSIVIVEDFILVGVIRDIALLGAMFNPVTLKMAQKDVNKLYNKIGTHIRSNFMDKNINVFDNCKLLNEDDEKEIINIVENNIGLGKFTHLEDVILCLQLSLANTLSYIKNTKIPILQQVILNINDEVKFNIQEYYRLKFKQFIISTLGSYGVEVDDIVNILDNMVIDIENKLYANQVSPIGKYDRDLEYKKALMQNTPINLIDTSNVSFETLTDPTYSFNNNPYSVLSLLSELYELFSTNTYDISLYLDLLYDITLERVSSLDLQIFKSFIDTDEICSKYNMFSLMTYLTNITLFETVIDVSDSSYIVNYLESCLSDNESIKDSIKKIIKEITENNSDKFIYYKIIKFMEDNSDLNLSEFTLYNKPISVLAEYQNTLINTLLQVVRGEE